MMSGKSKSTKPPQKAERVSQFSTPVDDETFAFIQAIERFKIERGRAFPTWTDVLQILKGLGYEKKAAGQPPRS
jgi:hypothetical protein